MTSSISSQRAVAGWLFICCGCVFLMALIGAITRLTESGLSITDWNPIMGAIPPLNNADWQKAFNSYQQIPQYQLLHRGMTLEEFKGIFFWEWIHRLWGRILGIIFAVPLVYFSLHRQINKPLALRLLAIFALGGLQGFIGWFMVKSGLEVNTSVSPYRLALHLSFAVLIYILMLHTGLRLSPLSRIKVPQSSVVLGRIVFGSLVVTMIWGAFVAGLHAGEAYNTWPLMEGDVLPVAAFTLLPKWLNIFENLALVQFIHRWLAPLTVLGILLWVRSLRTMGHPQAWLTYLVIAAFIQIALGLSTLLTHVNIPLAVLHQAGALTLLTLMFINLWQITPQDEPLRSTQKAPEPDEPIL